MIEYLEKQNVDKDLINQLEIYRKENGLFDNQRVIEPEFKYYGKEVLEEAISAILAGKNILLTGAKATGKNVLSSNLSYLFARPSWNVSFHVNTDFNSLIGADTFKNGEVVFRKGPIYQAATNGGFAILDEINMAKNEAISVLHATLDHRRIIDLPGYEKIKLDPNTRFIATMNYGYVGTREVNEALASRFMIISMPNISRENLDKLLKDTYPKLKEKYRKAFIDMFISLQSKSENNEISTKSVDLRGLMSAIDTMQIGLNPFDAIMMGIANKSFDEFERQIVIDTINTKIPANIEESIFND
ncbi:MULTISPECIES: AAA family ATPase [Anaerococcus]|uniref:Nitric-oxide reductase n=1 Tax=Anaerococcus nagyae TaxID=1755241 RepID=A0A3E2TH83_9FIRM|nr:MULTISPECIES: AAA family ATPase [Anaerococcus]MBP2069847.1 MoxR-like ATPase [Anaerococcus nagyae]MDU2565719.1 AAA family ATPase [Anaerococcus sp.]MDU3211408.1 AAA family ATPase [Anaerococcus sp.]RGB75810.1 nitric-oxide reductase [Anaerococcus nagyae]